jgi:hypothetical protein
MGKSGFAGATRAELADLLLDLNGFIQKMGIYLLAIILAAGGAFIFQSNIMMDDWYSFADDARYQSTDTVAQGRPIFALLSRLAQDSFSLHPFNTVLFFAALAVFGFTVFRKWSGSPGVRLLLVSLFLTSPFLAEHMQFGCNQIPMAFALLMASAWFVTLSGAEERLDWASLAAGVLAAGLAIATRWEMVFLIFNCALIELSRVALQGKPGFRRLFTFATMSVGLSLILAVVFIFAAAYGTGIGLQTGGNYGTQGLIRSVDQFWPLLDRFALYWWTFLAGSHFLFPAILKFLFLVMFLCFAVQSVLAKDYWRLPKALLVLVPLSIGPLVLGLVTTNYPFRYTAVYPLALFPCYIAALALCVPRSIALLRAMAVTAGSAVVLISAANLSAAQVRLNNLNRLEFSELTQVLAQIRSADQPDWKIALLGQYTDPGRSSGPAWGWNSLECGVFNCWANPIGSMLELTLMDANAGKRIFQLSDADRTRLQPDQDAMAKGSSRLVRIDQTRWVLLLK